MTIKCVCAIIPSSNWDITGVGAPDSYLCVMSHKRGGKVGLPGGKIADDETPEQAIAREVMEETGLVYDQDQFILLGCLPDGEHETYLFTAPPPNIDAAVRPSAEGDVSWLGRAELTGTSTGAYPSWNRWAFGRYDAWCTAMGQPASSGRQTVARVLRAFRWLDLFLVWAQDIAAEDGIDLGTAAVQVGKVAQLGLRNAGLLEATETVTQIATHGPAILIGYNISGMIPSPALVRKRLRGDIGRRPTPPGIAASSGPGPGSGPKSTATATAKVVTAGAVIPAGAYI